MKLVDERAVEGAAADQLWLMYQRAFADLRQVAAQRHALTRAEFDAVLTDERVAKYVVVDPARDGAAAGMSTLTNQLDAVSLVSPDYFASRWPNLFESRQIWYVGFLAVDPDYQGTGVIARLIGRMCAEAAATGGVIAADICEFNEQSMRLPTAFARLARTFSPGINQHRLDAQVYWAYEFPTPA
jgi:GNAT superfamily N-acetyltransferase